MIYNHYFVKGTYNKGNGTGVSFWLVYKQPFWVAPKKVVLNVVSSKEKLGASDVMIEVFNLIK